MCLVVYCSRSRTMWSRCSVIFFFSSRRRHTRSDRDWSSDVCSSDLERGAGELARDELAGNRELGEEHHEIGRIRRCRALNMLAERGRLGHEMFRRTRSQPPVGCSTWPPNLWRIAESTFSAKVCSRRERKRAKREAARTSQGTASSSAAMIVQRPSPESATTPV